ncbi:hypothetical protein [uncultured Enterovirga sp.]|uniref:hypothetical protein n=1 Tax=uncultured Enterovirga sp. TaxID=2026352 RepID=UPI0035CA29CB
MAAERMMSKERRQGEVVPFPVSNPQGPRRQDDGPDERGVLLLFTGVRYERAAPDAPVPPSPGDRTRPTRRRRVGR